MSSSLLKARNSDMVNHKCFVFAFQIVGIIGQRKFSIASFKYGNFYLVDLLWHYTSPFDS